MRGVGLLDGDGVLDGQTSSGGFGDGDSVLDSGLDGQGGGRGQELGGVGQHRPDSVRLHQLLDGDPQLGALGAQHLLLDLLLLGVIDDGGRFPDVLPPVHHEALLNPPPLQLLLVVGGPHSSGPEGLPDTGVFTSGLQEG